MSIHEPPLALPKLYGAPAYARPTVPVARSPRPFDPDQLPLEVDQTGEEHGVGAHLPARDYTPALDLQGDPRQPAVGAASGGLRPRQFSLRAIAGRLLGGQ